jgi:glutaredoxin
MHPYNVRIYTADFNCPFCDRAKSLLNRLGIKYTEHVGELPTGLCTYPQIYFGQDLIGGCSDLYNLYQSGYFTSYGKPH